MHHMMEKASTIWSKETGLDRNPADQVEVMRPDDQRDRYLSEEELRKLKQALDEKTYRKGTWKINKTFYRLRVIVPIAVTTGMRRTQHQAATGAHCMDRQYGAGNLEAVGRDCRQGERRLTMFGYYSVD